jgi:hypothetical protein
MDDATVAGILVPGNTDLLHALIAKYNLSCKDSGKKGTTLRPVEGWA